MPQLHEERMGGGGWGGELRGGEGAMEKGGWGWRGGMQKKINRQSMRGSGKG